MKMIVQGSVLSLFLFKKCWQFSLFVLFKSGANGRAKNNLINQSKDMKMCAHAQNINVDKHVGYARELEHDVLVKMGHQIHIAPLAGRRKN